MIQCLAGGIGFERLNSASRDEVGATTGSEAFALFGGKLSSRDGGWEGG